LPIIDVAPVRLGCVEPSEVAGGGVEALVVVSPAFDEIVEPADDCALTLLGSCAGALLEPAHAADKTAQVKAMMVVFI
jgi:hypothetical protein